MWSTAWRPDQRFWNGAFAHPTDTVITDQFGMKRLYNGKLRSYHGGMDFRAADRNSDSCVCCRKGLDSEGSVFTPVGP